jgi:hypothetical protein
VRLFYHSVARSFLVAMVAASLVCAPCLQAADKPLGSIVLAQSSFLGNEVAIAGADVYAGDTLHTNDGGLMRLKMRDNQFYLSSNTTATLSRTANGLHAILQGGTAGFSAAGTQVEVETPIATIRSANSQRAFGQITLTGPNQITVSAYEGSLLLEGAEGSEHTINAGQTYSVALVDDTSSAQTPEGVGGKNGNGSNVQAYRTGKKKLILTLILLGGTIGGGAFIYHFFSESCSDPDC